MSWTSTPGPTTPPGRWCAWTRSRTSSSRTSATDPGRVGEGLEVRDQLSTLRRWHGPNARVDGLAAPFGDLLHQVCTGPSRFDHHFTAIDGVLPPFDQTGGHQPFHRTLRGRGVHPEPMGEFDQPRGGSAGQHDEDAELGQSDRVLLQRGTRHRGDLLAGDQGACAADAAVLGQQSERGVDRHRLAAAGLTDQAVGLSISIVSITTPCRSNVVSEPFFRNLGSASVGDVPVDAR